MDLQLQITLRGIGHSQPLETAIRQKAGQLKRVHDRLTSCRVVVEVPARHRQQGREFVVHVELKVPGADIAVNRSHHEDPHAAVRDAFDAARRKLEEHAHVKRGDVKSHAEI